jgi:hypothetical protein
MNKLLKSALIELRRDGINLDPVADLEHILALSKLADRVTDRTPAIGEASLLRPAMTIGNVTLRHLSQGAQIFLVEVVAGQWWPDDTRNQNRAYAFCMAHTDQPEKLWQLQASRMAFNMAMYEWEKTITIPAEDLQAAIKAFQQEGREESPDATPTAGDYRVALAKLDALRTVPEAYRAECENKIAAMEVEEDNDPRAYGPIIEMLVREYGHDPDYWMWRISARDRSIIIANRNENIEAQNRIAKGHSPDDRVTRAHHAFSVYIENLRKARKQ